MPARARMLVRTCSCSRPKPGVLTAAAAATQPGSCMSISAAFSRMACILSCSSRTVQCCTVLQCCAVPAHGAMQRWCTLLCNQLRDVGKPAAWVCLRAQRMHQKTPISISQFCRIPQAAADQLLSLTMSATSLQNWHAPVRRGAAAQWDE